MFGFDIVVTETTTVELEVDPAVAGTYYSDSDEEYGTDTTRIFHENKDDKYMLPFDKFEGERLDHQHELLTATLDDKMYLAPIKPDEIKHILDIGTGNGKWAADFATEHPNTEVIGTDLSLPERESVPENCKFVIADAEEPWDFPHKFDFVHLRDLMMCFSNQKEVFKSAFDALEPGGYCQILDAKLPLDAIDDSVNGTAVAKWFEACVQAGEASGRPWTNIPKYMEWMEDIGFEEVTETVYHNPINDWAIGAKEKKWSEAEVDKLLLETKKSGKDRNVHAYIPIITIKYLTGYRSITWPFATAQLLPSIAKSKRREDERVKRIMTEVIRFLRGALYKIYETARRQKPLSSTCSANVARSVR
ncbi:hypothetical protein DID88_000904 [Monilinia fructigena]|uniref:Methyltransferase domain-containing protein n=1 Tax=Monilinia fructigena TaxID=38457 RepID=A0A395IZ98_9HELO|nr:hypothetical protein DID88_000904 [Monilinia fructigena]